MKSASRALPVKRRRIVVPFQRKPEQARRRTRLPAGRARDRGDAAVADRPRWSGNIILLFCVALIWSWWGTIDIVASATGKIMPSGRTKVIQPFETGVVRAIRVQDGQAVKAGDVLVELDPTVNAAERDHLPERPARRAAQHRAAARGACGRR